MQDNLDEILENFAGARSIPEAVAAGDALLKAKLVNKARLDPRFERGIEHCVSNVSVPPAQRLQALSVAYRMGASSKPVMAMVRKLAVPRLKNELPAIELLAGGQERYYAALAILDADGPWVAEYVSRAIAREETAETARRVLAERLLRSASIADALSSVAGELSKLEFLTENVAESASRRLTRVIAAIRPAVVAATARPGEEIGTALKAFFRSAFSGRDKPEPGAVTESLAKECCALLHDILRTQLSVVADPTVYQSLMPVRDWVGDRIWPRFVQRCESASSVLRALEDAILLLAKQRLTDSELLSTLQMFCSRDQAASRAAVLAESNPGLDPEVREWLSRFGKVRTTKFLSSMAEAKEAGTDPALASLLVNAAMLQADGAGEDGSVLRDVIVGEIMSLAAARNLELSLTVGQIVEYSPIAHELVGGHALGIKRVEVLRPMVERIGSTGIRAVALKAMVKEI